LQGFRPIHETTVVRVANARGDDGLRRMTIELTTRAAARALADYLEQCDCTVTFVSERVLEVLPPARAQSARDEAIEMEAYLRVWSAMNPTIKVTRIPSAD
jgi:hypothetical protein